MGTFATRAEQDSRNSHGDVRSIPAVYGDIMQRMVALDVPVVPSEGQPRVLFMGLPGGASAAVLSLLLDARLPVAGVVVPGSRVPHLTGRTGSPLVRLRQATRSSLSIISAGPNRNTMSMAWDAGVPMLAVNDMAHPATLDSIRSLSPDILLVACFPTLVPAALRRLAPAGALNIHPSLLPDYRGPSPVFWMLRAGDDRYGVTIHHMDDRFDAGDIIVQAPAQPADANSESRIEQDLMQTGGRLAVQLLARWNGRSLPRRPQPAGGSYYGRPKDSDFEVSTDWSAARAFNFMRATFERGRPYPIDLGGQTVLLAAALAYDPQATLATGLELAGGDALIRFRTGVLRAKLAPAFNYREVERA